MRTAELPIESSKVGGKKRRRLSIGLSKGFVAPKGGAYPQSRAGISKSSVRSRKLGTAMPSVAMKRTPTSMIEFCLSAEKMPDATPKRTVKLKLRKTISSVTGRREKKLLVTLVLPRSDLPKSPL